MPRHGSDAPPAEEAPQTVDAPSGSAFGPSAPHPSAETDPRATLSRRQRRLLRLVLAPAVLILVGTVVWLLGTTLLPFVVAGLLAVLLSPLVERMHRWGLPRPVAAVAMTAGVVLLLAGVLAAILPLLAREVADLSTRLPDLLSEVYWWLRLRAGDALDLPSQAALKEQFSGMVMPAREYVSNLLSYGLGLFSAILLVFVTPFLTAYLLADWPRVIERSRRLLPRRSAPTIGAMMGDMQAQLGAFIRGQLLIVLWQGILHATGLMLIGLQFGLMIGILTGLSALVPVIGNLTMFAVAMITAVIQFTTPGPILGVIAIYTVSQLLETTVLTPWLIGERVRLHPVWVIFALLIGGSLFGLVGALLAMPVAAILRVLFAYTVERYRNSRLYEEL